jgi:hypothetical protein
MEGFSETDDFALARVGKIGVANYTWLRRGGVKCDVRASTLPRGCVRGALAEGEAIGWRR